jgi:hypothetical protein
MLITLTTADGWCALPVPRSLLLYALNSVNQTPCHIAPACCIMHMIDGVPCQLVLPLDNNDAYAQQTVAATKEVAGSAATAHACRRS